MLGYSCIQLGFLQNTAQELTVDCFRVDMTDTQFGVLYLLLLVWMSQL